VAFWSLSLRAWRGAMSKKKENDLRKAALEGDVPMLTSIIASGVNIEAPHPKDGQTSLMYASSNGYLDAMDVLIKAGANLDGKDKFGFTALMVAATTGEADAIRSLLASGAKVDATDNFGNTALFKAREQKNAEAAQVLEDFMRTGGVAPPHSAEAAQSAPEPLKRPAPDDSDDAERAASKRGKAKVEYSTDELDVASVSQSVAHHLAQSREHVQLARTVVFSFKEAGGDPRSLVLSQEDLQLLVKGV